MVTLSEKLSIIENAINALPNINWSKYVKGTAVRDISEYQELLDNTNQYVDKITKHLLASFEKDHVDEVIKELERLKILFTNFSLLTDQSSEQGMAIQSMKEIVRKLKDSFRL